jgi:hypothetical protein
MQSSDESQGERGKYFVAHGEVVRTGSPWERLFTALLKLSFFVTYRAYLPPQFGTMIFKE